jgi:hypothetical protein
MLLTIVNTFVCITVRDFGMLMQNYRTLPILIYSQELLDRPRLPVLDCGT